MSIDVEVNRYTCVQNVLIKIELGVNLGPRYNSGEIDLLINSKETDRK